VSEQLILQRTHKLQMDVFWKLNFNDPSWYRN